MGPVNALGFWVLYFAPTLIAWRRSKKGFHMDLPVRSSFLFNLMLGWTIVMWFLLLANAFGYNPVPWLAAKFLGLFGTGGPQGGSAAPVSTGGASSTVCGHCGGTGLMTCTTCRGRGNWYDAPTTASGVAQLQRCSACNGSGKVQCTYH